VLSPIETGVIDDMFGRVEIFFGGGGFFNAVLSDTKGRPWKGHNFMVRFFGAPLSSQQGFMEFHSDDAIKNPESEMSYLGPFGFRPFPLNIYGNEISEPGNFVDYGAGGFPPTVAAWLAKQYRELDPIFKTVTIPAGYSSKQEAADDVAEKTALRSANLESRRKYVEAFIVANNLETPNSNKHEIILVNSLRKTVLTSFGELFVPGATLGTEEAYANITGYEQFMLYSVLTGSPFKCCEDLDSAAENWAEVGLAFLTLGISLFFDDINAINIEDGKRCSRKRLASRRTRASRN